MKVLLLTTPGNVSRQSVYFPLGLGYISAILEKHGIDIRILDSASEKSSWKEFKKKITKSDADIFGVACNTHTRFDCFKAARIIKEINPNAKTILGGPHMYTTDLDTLKNIPEIDAIVRGEGEFTMLELVNKLERNKSLKDVKGVTYREGNRIIRNPERPLMDNLDRLPFPARHLLSLRKYQIQNQSVPVMFSRGCSMSCVFCGNRVMWGRRVRFRSPESVGDELEYLVNEYNVDFINVLDDTFNINPKWAMKVCDEIINRKLDLKCRLRIRADRLTEELVKKMKIIGCKWAGIGLESASPRILKRIRKLVTVDQVRDSIKLCVKYGINPKVFTMANLPGETFEDMKMTLAFSRMIKRKYREQVDIALKPAIAVIYPGTDLENLAYTKGILPRKFRWSQQYYNLKNIIVGVDPRVPIYENIRIEKLAAFFFKEHVISETFYNLKSIAISKNKFRDIIGPTIHYFSRFIYWDG